MKDFTPTTVKLKNNFYREFKILGIRNGLTLQDFVEKCLTMYISESTFRKIIDENNSSSVNISSSVQL
jgi:hypothetical protein